MSTKDKRELWKKMGDPRLFTDSYLYKPMRALLWSFAAVVAFAYFSGLAPMHSSWPSVG